MHRSTAVILACALPLAESNGQSWVERSNHYTNMLLEGEFAHAPERGYTRLLALRQEVEKALGTRFRQQSFSHAQSCARGVRAFAETACKGRRGQGACGRSFLKLKQTTANPSRK